MHLLMRLAIVVLFMGAPGLVIGAERRLDNLPPDYAARMFALQKALASDGEPEVARGLYIRLLVWNPSYGDLDVCFFGGSDEVRSLIAQHALDWLGAEPGIVFDFGEPGKFRNCGDDPAEVMEVRIGFEDKKGWWSAIGSTSIVHFPQDKPSMNLQDFANLTHETWQDIDTLTVRHEFGHVLALMHEHQNPKGPCEEEFDWDRIYKLLGEGPDGLPKEVIDFNMRKLDKWYAPASAFDKRSIMMYRFGAAYYKTGEQAACYLAKDNVDISSGDYALMLSLYPKRESERLAAFASLRRDFEERWGQADPALKAAVGFDPIATYFGPQPE
jgi:hypothetical protein